MTYRLSKSRFMGGLQCHKKLWLTIHEPDAPELVPDAQQQWLFDHGHRVGEAARQFCGQGILIVPRREDRSAQVTETSEALELGEGRIFEASFSVDGVFVAIDVLERVGAGWRVVEVKSSTKAKPEHVPDLALQVHVARGAGLEIVEAAVLHLNREHRHPDVGPLFTKTDVTADVESFLRSVPDQIRRQKEILDGPEPKISVGTHCRKPYVCPFLDRCAPTLPAHHTSEFYSIRQTGLQKLLSAGYDTIKDVPATTKLSSTQQRQRTSVLAGEVVVEPELHDRLAQIEAPVAVLDFETVGLPLPVWVGTSPWQQVPVQFCVLTNLERGEPEPTDYLAEGVYDPRPELARALVESLRGVQTILAWHASFEVRAIKHLSEVVPELGDELREISERVVDLLKIVREHVYHPDFRGSFSIKSVYPALCGEEGYAGLEVADGWGATTLLEQILLRGAAPAGTTVEQQRDNLKSYCRLDAMAVFRVFGQLRTLLATRSADARPSRRRLRSS